MNAPATQSSHQPISEKRLAANRANAQKSTGPKTPEGKLQSSQNALRHAGYAEATLLPTDNPEEFAQFRTDWLESLSPQSTPELYLTDRAVSLAWRLQRIVQADTALHLTLQSQHIQQATNLRNHPERLHDLKNIPYFKNLADKSIPIPELSPAQALADATDGDNPNPFDQLNKSEDRLQSMLDRTLKQLRQLQTQRIKTPPPPCPYGPEEENPRNEPTDPENVGDSSHHTSENAQNEPTTPQPQTQNPQNEPTGAPPTMAIPSIPTQIPSQSPG